MCGKDRGDNVNVRLNGEDMFNKGLGFESWWYWNMRKEKERYVRWMLVYME